MIKSFHNRTERELYMKKSFWNGKTVVWLALLLCVVTLWQIPVTAVENSLDYGKGGADDVELSASELFDALFGETEAPLTACEKSSLDALLGIAMRYNQSIPPLVIDRDYDGDHGLLTVCVSPYSYVAQNGVEVIWLPTAVSLDGGEAKPLQDADGDGKYTCEFSNIWHSDEIELTVDFVWQVEISAETADGLLTYPYTVARESLDALISYETAKKTYDDQAKAYADYEAELAAYRTAKKNFEDYQSAMAVYTPKKQAYDDYVAAKAKFDADMLAYKEYEKIKAEYDAKEKLYFDYEKAREQYASIYDQYEPFLKGMEAANARLAIMDSMFLKDSHGWQFYSGVMGGTVDQVLANKHILETKALVPAEVLDNAEKATHILRPLLKGYRDVAYAKYSGELARSRAKFAYYSGHYEEIRDGITLLYASLHNIYGNSAVVTAMKTDADAKQKLPHFRQFLGQLYVLYCALDQQATPNPAWVLSAYDKYTLGELVEPELLLPADVNPSPEGVTLPDTEIELPEGLPEPVEKPVKDFVDLVDPSIEGAPVEVKNPGKPPVEVDDPGDPPTEVFPPEGDEPTAPVLLAAERTLAEELRAGRLQKREAKGTSQLLTFTRKVSCIKTIDNRKTVSFYDLDGTLIKTVFVEYGEAVASPDMTREGDEIYSSYLFLGWVHYGETDISNRVSLQSITTDLYLKPIYETVKRVYEITWVVGSQTETTTHHWGETPVCPLNTEKTHPTILYTFTGWSPTLTEVRGNATYTAQYQQSPKAYTVSWVMGDRTVEERVLHGKLPIPPSDTSRRTDDYVYEFLEWDHTIQAATRDMIYTARYTQTPLATSDDGTVYSAIHADGEVILLASRPVVNFSNASQYARKIGAVLTVQWGDFSVSLNKSAQTKLTDAKCTKLEWDTRQGEYAGETYLSLRCLNSVGKELNLALYLWIDVSYEKQDGLFVMAYRVNGKKLVPLEKITRYGGGGASFQIRTELEYVYRPEYLLTFAEQTQNCDLSAFPKHAPVGSAVSLRANCSFGYEISSAILTKADGTQVTVTEDSFLMTDEPYSIELTVTPITYYVTFVVDGEVISEQHLFFGDRVEIPEDPTKAEDEDYIYTFEGWSPYVTGATGENRAPVYTATFSRTAKTPVATPEDDVQDRFLTVVVLIFVGVLLLVAAVVLSVIYRRQIKRFLIWLAGKTVDFIRRAWIWIREKWNAAVRAISARKSNKTESASETEQEPSQSADDLTDIDDPTAADDPKQ